MEQTKSVKSILKKLEYSDDAKVMKQLVDQSLSVKTRMGKIRRKIAVLSGKGGVGKSMTTVNLAVAFARLGLKVGILDVDLNGPCVPKMLGMKGEKFIMSSEGAIPPVGPYGIKVASMEFFLGKDRPVQWKGSMDLSPVWLGVLEMNVIREFLGDILWGELDLLLADLPPGAAADKPPVIASYIPELDGAIVVTTPSEVTGDVVRKSIVYTRDVGIRVIGLIENMSGFLCPECHTESELFDGSSDLLCQELNVPLLGKIPFSKKMSHACDHGQPLSDETDYAVKKFSQIAAGIMDQLKFKKIGG
jgi:ATP-binding protein involved in chromosome partitioning